MTPFLILIYQAIDIYFYILMANIILSWLIAFNIVNMQNKFVVMILVATNKLTDPLLNPIRKIVPNLGGIDVSPIILVLLLIFIQNNIKYNFLT
ncbi:MAG: YggT family protein [Candidatus Pelagibacterales bacterium]|jgi:YggT family protein|tara:strand:- start:4921 stop:5202 length:282 start_codon:yes stop_codon:yes gene_type:complete